MYEPPQRFAVYVPEDFAPEVRRCVVLFLEPVTHPIERFDHVEGVLSRVFRRRLCDAGARLCVRTHNRAWTKPLRGSFRVVIVGANPSYCIFEKSDCDIMEALLVAALPCRKGASHDCSSTTNDGGYAGTECVASHAGIVSPTGFTIRTSLRQVAGCADSRAHSRVSSLSDEREEAGCRFNTHRSCGTSLREARLSSHYRIGFASPWLR
jgi:hypothetical protein